MRISLCMITRDEAANLPRCLNAIAGAVDEVCIYDTGSTDGTVAVADEHGAVVERGRWDDDFAAARNRSLALATGNWILVLDADEELADPQARARLTAFAARFPDRAGQVTVRDQNVSGSGDEVHSLVTRFFANDRTTRFTGRIHEQLERAGRPLPRAHTGVDVLHYGYSAVALASRRKLERNARLLERELADRPTCAYTHYQLGLTRGLASDAEGALRALTEALRWSDPDAPFLAHLAESLGANLRQLDRREPALELIATLAERYPDRGDTIFLEGLLAMELGQLDRAEACFLRCLGLAGSRPAGGAFSPGATTTAPAHNLGALYEVCGRPDYAEHYYRMALGFDAHHEPSEEGLARLDAMTG